MTAIISIFEMRCAEKEAIASGISEHDLMYNAGLSAAQEIIRFCENRFAPRHRQRYYILAGGGNNGGDAFMVAHHLNAPVDVFTTTSTHNPPAADFRQDLELQDTFAPKPGSIIIDGLLGIGLKGDVRPEMATLIDKVNASGLPVISLDIPSGLNADDGTGSHVIRADMTIAMHSPKLGMFINQGPESCGIIRTVSIGIPNNFTTEEHILAFGEMEARLLLTRRPPNAHKYNCGHLLCLAGSSDYPGAPILAARAAERCGAGLVTLAVPSHTPINPVDAALIIKRLSNENDFQPDDLASLDLSKYNAILFGPGIGRNVPADFLLQLLENDTPLVIDADGLRLLASCGKKAAFSMLKRKAPVILTPHKGELEALKKGIPEILNLFPPCLYLVDKGPQSKIHAPDGSFSINTSGDASLATAGTGDVLSGMIASFMAQGMLPYDAARLAVYIHGHAANISCLPRHSLIADDLLHLIPIAMADISPLF